ncbi:flagellar assembly peptidoglycan hydrolase FlgJ [Aliamphritea spongicola]|uniref:flagellar assembly peptidoglycan hydrolase FlgJ n=1 Tax=Aliamphritea spongicola TaxID=707589 RepID=UPI00196B2B1D|nr:flagellar assembly peptidoglycan hydrolase FlgJ [Aliamphritea spongicola]MBN3563482.1 flagellar assembly peptidoglycan hydrolase FlgJ [Aliamphritea spongicola]
MKTNASQNAQLYTEFNEMNKLRQQAKDKDPAALQAVAEQFEQLFMNMMMKSMRQANDVFSSDNPLNSSKVKFYQDMADTQLTKDLSESGGIGLADIIVKQLSAGYGVQLDAESDQAEEKNNLSESEQLLSRAFDSTASAAASAILGQAQQRSAPEKAESVQPVRTTEKVAAVNEQLPGRFETPEEFVGSLMPIAEKVAGELGVDPKVLLAQAALETGWGKHVIQQGGESSFNLFNIKADSRWQGEQVQVSTLEYRDGVAQREQAAFRSYGSYEESFNDYVSFLKNSPRYQNALQQAANPFAYVDALQQAGYATDPEYSNKISRIYSGELISQADNTGSLSANSGINSKES